MDDIYKREKPITKIYDIKEMKINQSNNTENHYKKSGMETK